jgi:hypothetical protein
MAARVQPTRGHLYRENRPEPDYDLWADGWDRRMADDPARPFPAADYIRPAVLSALPEKLRPTFAGRPCVPFFGRALGFIINYSPEKALRCSLPPFKAKQCSSR